MFSILVGSGVWTRVWRGTHRQLVAVKVVRERLADPLYGVKVQREAWIASLLQHPGITVDNPGRCPGVRSGPLGRAGCPAIVRERSAVALRFFLAGQAPVPSGRRAGTDEPVLGDRAHPADAGAPARL